MTWARGRREGRLVLLVRRPALPWLLRHRMCTDLGATAGMGERNRR